MDVHWSRRMRTECVDGVEVFVEYVVVGWDL